MQLLTSILELLFLAHTYSEAAEEQTKWIIIYLEGDKSYA